MLRCVYWVRVSAEFQCRACGHASPLNYLDLDGSVCCARCGLDQAFAASSWREALEHAHAVADLAGSAEGRHPSAWLSIAGENPFKDVTSAAHHQSGFAVERGMQVPQSMVLTASLAEPQCEGCGVPLAFQRLGPELRSSCPRCSQTRSYRLPPNAQSFAPGLVGVMTEEHRTDQAITRVADDREKPGAIALTCPTCGGGLQVAAGERVVACDYGHKSSRIPEKTLFRLGGASPRPEPWWLAFDGPSKTRRLLERDPALPADLGTVSADIQAVQSPKKKKLTPLDLALVVMLPLFCLLVAGALDYFVLQELGIVIPL